MSQLDRLLQVKGLLGALRFLDDGGVDEFVGSIDPSYAELVADLCFANSRIAQQQADLLVAFTGFGGWSPPRGWAMMGPELSVCGMGSVACFVNRQEVSFNELFTILFHIART